jgi:hypothetical protein
MNFDAIDAFTNDLDTLKKGYELLELVYAEMGPYFDRSISDETQGKLNTFFKFDDSY